MSNNKPKIIQTKPEPWCPLCGGRMKLRRPDQTKGQDWPPFWGCMSYPDCRGKRQIKDDGTPMMEDKNVSL